MSANDTRLLNDTTINQAVQKASGVTSDFIVRDMSKDILTIEPYQTPFLAYLWMSQNVVSRQIAHPQGLAEFPETEIVPNLDVVTTTSAGGSATITVTPAEPNLYVVGTSVQFVETGESGICTTAGATPVFTRDKDTAGNSRNWTAPTAGTQIKILGTAFSELDTPPENTFVYPQMRKTAVQLFQETIKMTDMMVAATKAGGTYGGNWWDLNQKNKLAQFKIGIENAMWFNQDYFVDTGSGIKNKMEGIIYQIRNNGGNVLPYASPSAFTKTVWKEYMRMNGIYGSKNKVVFAGTNVVNSIEDFIEEKITYTTPIDNFAFIKGTNTIDVLKARVAGLNVSIIRNPMWDDSYSSNLAVCLDEKYLQSLHFAPDDKGSRKMRFEVEIQANGAPRKEALFLSQVAVGVGCGKCHGILEIPRS